MAQPDSLSGAVVVPLDLTKVAYVASHVPLLIAIELSGRVPRSQQCLHPQARGSLDPDQRLGIVRGLRIEGAPWPSADEREHEPRGCQCGDGVRGVGVRSDQPAGLQLERLPADLDAHPPRDDMDEHRHSSGVLGEHGPLVDRDGAHAQAILVVHTSDGDARRLGRMTLIEVADA